MKTLFVVALLFVTITASATLAPCNLTQNAPRGQLMSCTIKLPQIAGGVVTRVYGVFVPMNYVPGQSFLLLKISGTTHKIANDCPLAPAGPELMGWLPFLQTAPAPAPVLVCPQGWLNTGTTNNGERWRMWGFETAPYNGTWVTNSLGQPVIPDDQGFLDAIIPLVISGLQLQSKIAVTNDWGTPSIVASQFTARRPDLVSVLALYNDDTFDNISKGPNGELIDTDGSIIQPPTGPVNAIFVESYLPKSFYQAMYASMCGSGVRQFTADDRFAYWTQAIQPTTAINYDPSGSNTLFCSTTLNSYGGFVPTTLEAKFGTGGINGTEIQMYKLVGNLTGTPPCSYNYSGVNDPTMCNLTTTPPHTPIVLTVPPSTCSISSPCNHYIPLSEPTLLNLLYTFILNHMQ